MNKGNYILKDIFDYLVSFTAIIILSPMLLIISLLIKLNSEGPILFKQQRMGKNEIPFYIYKFRTMVTDAEAKGLKITVGNDPRITSVGRILRKTKLDELPQLFNIIRGEMSFVGPRPEVLKYTELYTKEQRQVFNVKPGITDLASIKYRNENEILKTSDNPEKTYIEDIMQEKLKINLEYIKNISLLNDIKLIFKTIKVVIFE